MMPAGTWSKTVPMEMFTKCLIWLQFIPVTQDKTSGHWQLSMFNLKFLLLATSLCLTWGYYSWTVLWQALTKTEGSTFNDWIVLVYKICLMSGPTFYPFVIGIAASAQETRACHSKLQIPATTFAFLCSMILLFNLGNIGIHVKEILHEPSCTAPIAVSALIGFLTFVACTLVTYTWILDLIATCPDGDQLELIAATDSDLFLHKYECLKSGTEYYLLSILSFAQILLVFSLYQSIKGKHLKRQFFLILYFTI
jgi:hypothetical protein